MRELSSVSSQRQAGSSYEANRLVRLNGSTSESVVVVESPAATRNPSIANGCRAVRIDVDVDVLRHASILLRLRAREIDEERHHENNAERMDPAWVVLPGPYLRRRGRCRLSRRAPAPRRQSLSIRMAGARPVAATASRETVLAPHEDFGRDPCARGLRSCAICLSLHGIALAEAELPIQAIFERDG